MDEPVGLDPMRDRFSDIEYAASAAAALEDAHGAVVVTGWDGFATLNAEFDAMASPVVVDGCRIVDPPATSTYEG